MIRMYPNNTTTWVFDEKSVDQIGCRYTSQGLEFDYVGAIIGLDLKYHNVKVITDYKEQSKNDRSLYCMKTNKLYEEADKIIRNTYKTL